MVGADISRDFLVPSLWRPYVILRLCGQTGFSDRFSSDSRLLSEGGGLSAIADGERGVGVL